MKIGKTVKEEVIVVDDKYTIKHLNGVGMVFRNDEEWKELTKYDLSVAYTIQELRAENKRLKSNK